MLVKDALRLMNNKIITLNNLLNNDGNFNDTNSDGLGDGWTKESGVTVSLTNNVQTLVNTISGGIYHLFSVTSGQKYYACAYLQATTPLVYLRAVLNVNAINSTHSGSGDFEFISLITDATATGNAQIKIYDSRSNGYSNYQTKLVHVINLTQCFGAGSEPSKSQMDSIMVNAITQGYFTQKVV